MRRYAVLVLILLTVFLTSCGPIELASLWRKTDVTIDGRADDWQGALYSIEDKPFFVGVRNDADFIYVCLQVADPRTLSPIMRSGFVAWFDPSGGNARVLGVKFPIGMSVEPGEVNPEGPRDHGGAGRPPVMNRDQVEILGPEKDAVQRLKKDELRGIEVALESGNGFFVYELKIPMVKGPDTPFAVGVGPGKTVGITFETLSTDRNMPGRGEDMTPAGGGMGGGYGGRGGMGGMGGMGGGRGGRGGRGGGGSGGKNSEPLKLKLKVSLAKQPS
ncbi:MAG: hypothetical protein ABSA30_08060 [Candidatus Aminicenantales bacterium]